jgi:hypothetical protein
VGRPMAGQPRNEQTKPASSASPWLGCASGRNPTSRRPQTSGRSAAPRPPGAPPRPGQRRSAARHAPPFARTALSANPADIQPGCRGSRSKRPKPHEATRFSARRPTVLNNFGAAEFCRENRHSHERQMVPGGNVYCGRNRPIARRREPAESRLQPGLAAPQSRPVAAVRHLRPSKPPCHPAILKK